MFFLVKKQDLTSLRKDSPTIFPSNCVGQEVDNVCFINLKSKDNKDIVSKIIQMVSCAEKIKTKYLILTCKSSLIGKMMSGLTSGDIRYIYVPPTKDPQQYIDIGIKLLDYDYVPKIGVFKTIGNMKGHQDPSGILPLIRYKDETFCILAVDKKTGTFSDFGGGFDKKSASYPKGSPAEFKNGILQDKHISNGYIDPLILYDNMLMNNDEKNIQNLLDKETYGNGDLNTKYTAFRELIEESAYTNKPKTEKKTKTTQLAITTQTKTKSVFDINVIYEKLYNSSYVYLGGDTMYGYDMYLVVMTENDLSGKMKYHFESIYQEYKEHPKKYIRSIANGEHQLKLDNNDEMKGVVIVPLKTICDDVANISYTEYKTDKLRISRNKNSKDEYYLDKDYHSVNYRTKLMDKMRLCFGDALVKYKKEFRLMDQKIDDLITVLSP